MTTLFSGMGQGPQYLEAIERALPAFRHSSFDPWIASRNDLTLLALERELMQWSQTASLPAMEPGEFRPHLGEVVFPRRPPQVLVAAGLKPPSWLKPALDVRSNPDRRILNALLFSHRAVLWDEIGLQLTARKGWSNDLDTDHRDKIALAMRRTAALAPLIECGLLLIEPYRMGEIRHMFAPADIDPYDGKAASKWAEKLWSQLAENEEQVTPFTQFFSLWTAYRDHVNGRFDFYLDYLGDEAELGAHFSLLDRTGGEGSRQHRATVRLLTACGGLAAERLDTSAYLKIRRDEEAFGDLRDLISKSCKVFELAEHPLREDLYATLQAEAGRYRGRLRRRMGLSNTLKRTIKLDTRTIVGGIYGATAALMQGSGPLTVGLSAAMGAGHVNALDAAGSPEKQANAAFRAHYMLFGDEQ